MPDSIVKVLARRLCGGDQDSHDALTSFGTDCTKCARYERTLRDLSVEELVAAGEKMADAWDAEGYPGMREDWDAAMKKIRDVTKCPQCGVNKLAHGEFCDDTPGIATPELPMPNRTEPVTFAGLEEELRELAKADRESTKELSPSEWHARELREEAADTWEICAEKVALLRQCVEELRDWCREIQEEYTVRGAESWEDAKRCDHQEFADKLDALLGKAGT